MLYPSGMALLVLDEESYKNMIYTDKHSFGGPSERGFTYLPINNVQKAAKSKTFAEHRTLRRAGIPSDINMESCGS